MADLDPLNLIARWILLFLLLLFLTYIFRNKVILEGLTGYAIAGLIIVPLNIVTLSALSSSNQITDSPMIEFGVIFLFNGITLAIWNRWIPGLTLSGPYTWELLVLFFSAASVGVHLLPLIPAPVWMQFGGGQ